eukprot:scaffold1536_cov397-Prasinococcus_capsulatus_cf.AAC.15
MSPAKKTPAQSTTVMMKMAATLHRVWTAKAAAAHLGSVQATSTIHARCRPTVALIVATRLVCQHRTFPRYALTDGGRRALLVQSDHQGNNG